MDSTKKYWFCELELLTKSDYDFVQYRHGRLNSEVHPSSEIQLLTVVYTNLLSYYFHSNLKLVFIHFILLVPESASLRRLALNRHTPYYQVISHSISSCPIFFLWMAVKAPEATSESFKFKLFSWLAAGRKSPEAENCELHGLVASKVGTTLKLTKTAPRGCSRRLSSLKKKIIATQI